MDFARALEKLTRTRIEVYSANRTRTMPRGLAPVSARQQFTKREENRQNLARNSSY
jgi:hypothetical protein